MTSTIATGPCTDGAGCQSCHEWNEQPPGRRSENIFYVHVGSVAFRLCGICADELRHKLAKPPR